MWTAIPAIVISRRGGHLHDVIDRGPFVSGRIADLSEAAARRIGMVADGVVEAFLEILQPGKNALGGRGN